MNTDVSFVTGQSHKVCQDYARAGANYIIIADGCSGSPDSDFGARLLVKVAENQMEEKGFTSDWKHFDTITIASMAGTGLDLANQSLDATLLTAQVVNENVHIRMFGDGYLYVEKKDGTILVVEINFPSGYPYYLNYTSDMYRRSLIEKQYQDSGLPVKTIITNNFTSKFQNHESVKVECGLHEKDEHNGCTLDLPVSSVKMVALMSDGVASFYDKTDRIPTPALSIIKNLCAFKNGVGEAAHRRLNAFLRDAEKNNLKHDDDVSLGIIYVGE